MGKKAMKAPGVSGEGGNMRGTTKRSPIAPVMGQVKGTGMQVDDASSKVLKGVLRPKHGEGIGLGDATALGDKGTRGRTATTASAQFRVTAKRTPFTEERYPGTLAAGKVMPSVMGSKQNFVRGGTTYGPMS